MRQFKSEMKKLAFIGSSVISLLAPAQVLAANIEIERPKSGTTLIGYANIGEFIGNLVTIAFIVALIVVLIMLIIGAFEWIVSGGDKEAVGKARTRIINALIGLAVLAVAFALANLGAQILGLPGITGEIPIPGPKK